MRPRMTVLACTLAALVAAMAPGVAGAAPHHNYHLTIAAVPDPIPSGEGVFIYGRLAGRDSSGQTIYLYQRLKPQPFYVIVGRTQTGPGGYYEFSRSDVTTNRDWFVRGPDGSHSRTFREWVSALVTLASNQSTTTTGQPVVLTGQVTPAHPYEPVRIQEQDRLGNDGWSTIATTYTDGGSSFSLSHAWGRAGDYTLRAEFPGDDRNIRGESDTLTIVVQQKQNPSFTIDSSSPIIQEGQSVAISGVLYTTRAANLPEPGVTVTLYGAQHGQPLQPITTTTTKSDGSYSFTQTPIYNTTYRVETNGLKHNRATTNLYQGVQDVVTITPISPSATEGGTVAFFGTVSPDKSGRVIYLQRLEEDRAWHDVAAAIVTPSSTYSFRYRFGETGTFQFRARIYGDADNLGGASPPVRITVSGVAAVPTLPPAS